MNPLERVQTLLAQTSELRDAVATLVQEEDESPTTAAIVQLTLLSVLLADVVASMLAEATTGD